MKLKKRDLGLLLILLGIAIFLVCYLAVYNPKVEENAILEAQIAPLSQELMRLREVEAQLPTFYAEIAEFKETIEAIQEGFPMEIRPEDYIMYAVALETYIGLDTDGMSFTQPKLMVQIEPIIGPDGNVDFEEKFAYKSTANYTAMLTYNHMKELVEYVYMRSPKTTLDTVTVSYNASTGVLQGTFVVGKYFMTSDSDPYIETYVPPMPVGAPNPFGSLDEFMDPDAEEPIEVDDAGNAG